MDRMRELRNCLGNYFSEHFKDFLKMHPEHDIRLLPTLLDLQAPKEALELAFAHFPRALESTFTKGRSLLHLAFISSGVQTEMVRLIANLTPTAAFLTHDDTGCLPIHLALKHFVSVGQVRLLVDRCPEALMTADMSGSLALHRAVVYPSVETHKMFIDAASQALLIGDKYGCLPVHMAIRFGSRFEVIECLAKSSQESLLVKECYSGLTPLHTAARSNRMNCELVNLLADLCPQAARTPDNNGALPLHHTIRGGVGPRSFGALIDKNPDALLHQQHEGRTPLYCALMTGLSLDLVQVIVERRPQALYLADSDGSLPFHLAAASSLSALDFSLACISSILHNLQENTNMILRHPRPVALNLHFHTQIQHSFTFGICRMYQVLDTIDLFD